VAGLLYTGSAAQRPLTMLAEQRDGRSLFGRSLDGLSPETFEQLARSLGIGLVVALEQDAGKIEFLTTNPHVKSLPRIGSFRLFSLADPVPELVPIGPQRWRISVTAVSPGWASLPVAYSPLWLASGDGAPLAVRRDERGLLEVAVKGPVSAVELEHRAGTAEWAGGALSLGAAIALLAVWWRRAARR
jgi:hypothetical protein